MSTQPISPDFNAKAQSPTELAVSMLKAIRGRDANEQAAIEILAAGADAQYMTADGRTLLDAAVVTGFPLLTKELILKGADPNRKNEKGRYSLSLAVAWNFTDIIEVLIDNGANPDIASDGGDPVLVMALMYSSGHETAKLLLNKGANPNITYGASQMTPLMLVCEKGDEAAIKMLLEAGADPLKKDAQGNDAFDYAKKHNPETFAFMTGLCHDIFLQPDKTPAERAAYMAKVMWEGKAKADEKALLAMLEVGADVRYMEERGRSLLDYAAIFGFADLTKKLIEKGADPNQMNPSGSYPIVYAAYRKGLS